MLRIHLQRKRATFVRAEYNTLADFTTAGCNIPERCGNKDMQYFWAAKSSSIHIRKQMEPLKYQVLLSVKIPLCVNSLASV